MSDLNPHLSGFLTLELSRTLSLKMQEAGVSTDKICQVLSVSPQFVSKWKKKYASGGISVLAVAYEGRPSYLSSEAKSAIISHISTQEQYSLKELVAYMKEHYAVVFKSPQSYDDLLSAGGLSWHKTQKSNPKREEEAVLKKRAELKKTGFAKGKNRKRGTCRLHAR